MIGRVVIALFVAAAGCVGPQTELPTYPAPPSLIQRVPPPRGENPVAAAPGSPRPKQPGADTPRSPRGTPVVPIAHAEPGAVSNTFVAAQPLPPPRPIEPDAKSGSDPPHPPKDVPPIPGSPGSIGGPLSLEEVLDSVERNYPLLRAVEQERAIRGGRLLSSMGAFDLNLTASADGQGTTYDNLRSGLGVNQGLTTGGVGVFAGYRNGFGEYPTYNLGQKTADGGEFRAGASIPLLQNRAIDRPRAAVQQARLDVAIAEPVIERQRLDFQRAAARTYWTWVAAGERLRVAEALVRLAVDRDDQLKTLVAEGRVAAFERVDNQQNIALRNGLLVQAQRAFQQATIDLSLFLRDADGRPTLAGPGRLPAFPEVRPIDLNGFDAALQTAFELRPEPRRLRLERDKAAVELQFAQNQTLPTLNAVVAASQDVGYGRSALSGPNGLDRSTVGAGLAFQLPVQRSDARGRMMAAQAQIAQIDQQLRQAEDIVRADVQDAFSALDRAVEFYHQARGRVELVRQVARAERERLRLGLSDVLRVTLREQAAFEAEVIEIGARQDYFRALADFRAALGIGGK